MTEPANHTVNNYLLSNHHELVQPSSTLGFRAENLMSKSTAALSRAGSGAGEGTFTPLSHVEQAIPLSRSWAMPWHKTRAWLGILELTWGHNGFNASLLLISRITKPPELEVTHKDHAAQHQNSSCTHPISVATKTIPSQPGIVTAEFSKYRPDS